MIGAFRRRASFYLWENEDGSPGGEVSVEAEVHPSAIIEQHATVLAGAIIGPGQVVPRGYIVEASGAMISFGETRPAAASASRG